MERLKIVNGAGWADVDAVLADCKNAFDVAMDNDLNTPEALASVFELMSVVNKNFDLLSKADGEKIAISEGDPGRKRDRVPGGNVAGSRRKRIGSAFSDAGVCGSGEQFSAGENKIAGR